MKKADWLPYMAILSASPYVSRRKRLQTVAALALLQEPFSRTDRRRTQDKQLPSVACMSYHFERRGHVLAGRWIELRIHQQTLLSLEEYMNGKCLAVVDDRGYVLKTRLPASLVEQYIFCDRSYLYQLQRVGNCMVIVEYGKQ